MKEPMSGVLPKEPRQQVRGGGGECRVIEHCRAWIDPCLQLQFGETEGYRFLDLPGQVEVVTRDMREERVDEMQTSQIVGRNGWHWV